MTIQNYVLIITVGQTDLQVVLTQDDNTTKRYELNKGSVRAIHQWLLENPGKYCMVETPEQRSGFNESITWHRDKHLPQMPNQETIEGIFLCAAKLEKVVGVLLANAIPPLAILLLTTQRQTGFKTNEEPIAAGKILCNWLAAKFPGLKEKPEAGQPEKGEIGWVNYLDGDMSMSGDGLDYPFNRTASARVIEALQRLKQDTQAETLVLSDGGGLPELKPILRNAGKLYFQHSYRLINSDDHKEKDLQEARLGQDFIDQSLLHTPVDEIIAIRLRVITLVKQGSFIEAYGVALALQDIASEQAWFNKIKAVRNYFVGESGKPSLLPISIRESLSGYPGALRIAFRIESALHCGRYNEAMSLSVTFAEQALKDYLQKYLGDNIARWDNIRKNINFSQPVQNETQLKIDTLRKYIKSELLLYNEKYRSLKVKFETEAEWLDFFEQQGIDPVCCLRTYLGQLKQEFRTNTRSLQPRQIRNIYMHGLPNEQEFTLGLRAFEAAGIWAENYNTTARARFLEQTNVVGILNNLGRSAPYAAYCDLIDSLCRDIRGTSVNPVQ